MLTFRQLDDLPELVVELMTQTEQSIINDMARRIARMGEVSASTNYQLARLEAISAVDENVRRELYRALNLTNKQLEALFDEAATRTLASDDKLYRAAGYNPTPLAENMYLQQIIRAGLTKTSNHFANLTRTTANTATRQFEQALDLAHMQIVTGTDYQTAIKQAIQGLARQGMASIRYPSGHVDFLDVSARRAVLTGVNQTAAEVQLANMQQMGSDLTETTAHASARPDHEPWQGRVFSVSGTHPKYKDFVSETGYGTGAGLCGWNCRHSFFPFFEELSDPAYDAETLRGYNNRTVTYNGEEMSLYDATQRQRQIERNIRRWKREESALDAAGLDSCAARLKVQEWQARQRNFIGQTGLRRDYFRERGGYQLASLSKDAVAANPIFMNRTDDLFRHGKNVKPIEGYEDVIVHGDMNGFAFRDSAGIETNISVAEFAEILKKTPTYKGGDIRLIACGTAAKGATAAQELADILGVKIIAPSDTVWIDFDGALSIGENQFTNTGKWVIIKPRGK